MQDADRYAIPPLSNELADRVDSLRKKYADLDREAEALSHDLTAFYSPRPIFFRGQPLDVGWVRYEGGSVRFTLRRHKQKSVSKLFHVEEIREKPEPRLAQESA